MPDALWMSTGPSSTPVGTAAITAADDTFTITGHGLADGRQIRTASPSGGAVGVLVAGAPYWVASATANTFQVRASPGGPVMAFTADGSASVATVEAEYEADELRRLHLPLMWPGSTGAATVSGIRPGNAAASLAGTTVTVQHCAGVTSTTTAPWTATSGPYWWMLTQQTLELNPADTTFARIDRLVARIQDHVVDGSGFRHAIAAIKVGTPAAVPVAPTVVAGEVSIGTINVPQSGGGGATLTLAAADLTALGGVRPAASAAARPTVGLYDSMTVFRTDTGALETRHSGAWGTVGNVSGYQYWQTITYDANGTFTKASYPGLRAVMIRCQGGGGAGGGAVATAASGASSGGGGQGGNYAETWVLASALSASETVTRGAGGTGVTALAGNNGGTSSVGAHCIAGGGVGGIVVSSTTTTWSSSISGVPITTATGDHIRQGDPGGFGLVNGSASFALGGAGGSSMWGAGAQARQPGGGQNGFPGVVYGGGGGGGGNWNSQATARSGGNGANGRVLIDLYV